MKLVFNAVGMLQTAIECPTCKRTGKETMFTECCCKYMLSLLGIFNTQGETECPLCGDDFVSDEYEIGCYKGYCSTNAIPTNLKDRFLKDNEGYCYAQGNCNEEFCNHFLPFIGGFSDNSYSVCQYYRYDGQCTA
jgi:hypothetical protein